jgi:anti-anti-sigma regulatory factor
MGILHQGEAHHGNERGNDTMEPIARVHQKDLKFAGSIPIVQLHGDAALAARELDEVWLPLLMTGHQNVIVTLDGLERLTPDLIGALSRVLTHVRGLGGEMVLVTTRPEFVEALRRWDVAPAVPVLLDVDSATAAFQPADASPAID